MQKRTSIKFLLKKLDKFLNSEISFEEIYFKLLKTLFKEKPAKTNSLSIMRPYIREGHLFNKINIHKPPQTKLVIRSSEPLKKVEVSQNILKNAYPLKVHSALVFDYAIKWITLNMESLLVKRQYQIDLSTLFCAQEFNNFDIEKNLKINKTSPQELKLPKRAFVIEELLEFSPYKNQLPLDLVFKIPMRKEATNLNELSIEQMEKFKNTLASSAKTNVFNMEILSVYDNFYPTFYSMIRRDNKTKKLLCFLDKKKHKIKESKSYYFIMGKTKDTKKTFTTLVEY